MCLAVSDGGKFGSTYHITAVPGGGCIAFVNIARNLALGEVSCQFQCVAGGKGVGCSIGQHLAVCVRPVVEDITVVDSSHNSHLVAFQALYAGRADAASLLGLCLGGDEHILLDDGHIGCRIQQFVDGVGVQVVGLTVEGTQSSVLGNSPDGKGSRESLCVKPGVALGIVDNLAIQIDDKATSARYHFPVQAAARLGDGLSCRRSHTDNRRNGIECGVAVDCVVYGVQPYEVVVCLGHLDAPCGSLRSVVGTTVSIHAAIFGKRHARIVAIAAPSRFVHLTAHTGIEEYGAAVLIGPWTRQIEVVVAIGRDVAVIEEELVVERLAIAERTFVADVLGSGNIAATLASASCPAYQITLIEITGAAAVDEVDVTLHLTAVVEVAVAFLGAVCVLIAIKADVLQYLTVASLIEGFGLRGGIGYRISHRDILHIEVGRRDGHRRCRGSIGLYVTLCGIADGLAVIVIPGDNDPVATFTDDADDLLRVLVSVTYKHLFLVGAIAHKDDGALTIVLGGIDGFVQCSIVTTAILSHNDVKRALLLQGNFFTDQTAQISLQRSVATAHYDVAVVGIRWVEAVGGFPCIVHTIVVVIGRLVVGFQFRIAAGITWLVDDAADAMVIEAAIACSRASADLVEDTRVGSVSGECSGFGQHAVVGLLCRLRLDGFGNGDVVGLHHVERQSRYILLIGIDVEGFVVVIIKTMTLSIAALHVVARQVPFAVALTLTALCWITERGTDEYSLLFACVGWSWLVVVVNEIQLEQAFVALTVVAAIAGILLAVVVVDVVHKVKQHHLVVLRRGTETR